MDVLQFLLDLIFQPGSSLKLVPAINITVLCLLGLMVYLTYTKIAVIHIIVMSSLAVGLLLSVNWFYYEFTKIVESNKKLEGAEGKKEQ